MMKQLKQNEFPVSIKTRFAPSPTGYLHLGHVLNAIFVWGIAGTLGGEVIVRIEDHDRGRYRHEYEQSIIEDIKWLGFDFDNFLLQRNRFQRYQEIADNLHSSYYCKCSRKQIAEYQTPELKELWYNGACRNKNHTSEQAGLRFEILDTDVFFTDLLLGEQKQTPAKQCGDLLLMNRQAEWTYQMAVVCDDFDQGINMVIRGQDILDSTGRQILLHKALGNKNIPVFMHHPLLYEKDGSRKLSKRQKSVSIRAAKEQGAMPETVLGNACFRAGLIPKMNKISANELPDLFKSLIS